MKREILERIDSVVAGYVNRYASDWTEIARPLVEKCDDSIPFMVMMRPSGVDVAFFGGDYLTMENAYRSQAALPSHELFLHYDGERLQSITRSSAEKLCENIFSCFKNVDLSMDGFYKAVERCCANVDANPNFNGSALSGMCGPWEIVVHSPAARTAMDIFYNQMRVAEAERTSLAGIVMDRVNDSISDKTFKEIFDTVHSSFPDYQMSVKEQARLKAADQNYDGNEMQSVTKNAVQELCDKASARFEDVALSMDGFNKALDRYEENMDSAFDSGHICGICGPWSLETDAANNMIFNVSYEGKLIVSASKSLMRFDEYEDGRSWVEYKPCFALKRELNISDKDFSEIVASIKGRFSSDRFVMEASEQEKVFKNLGHLGR